MAATLMVQGTTSNAGKSMLVTALCRSLSRRGIKVAPFKSQNMALNSAVTINGGEIGRAQAVQAQACGLEPHSDMNPILLKPTSDTGSQVIIQGKVYGNMQASAYHKFKPEAMPYVLESYRRLAAQFEVVVVEGAGSPAEINLREGDLANMGFAQAVDCPVILVADIELGGVFAHIVGTLELLSESERARVQGIVINRFRGDQSLLQPGLDWLKKKTGKKVLGVLPYLPGLHLEAEDSISNKDRMLIAGTHAARRQTTDNLDASPLRIVVPSTPHMSNSTDFDPLMLHTQVDLQFIKDGNAIPAADLIILPGSKNVKQDLDWLHQGNWDQAIFRHLRYGGKLIGICGGFQMLGWRLLDPSGIESTVAEFPGLGLLDLETTFQPKKRLTRVQGTMQIPPGPAVPVSGYEIHMGISSGPALARPLITCTNSVDGAISDDNQIIGTYVHGLFDSAQSCAAILQWCGLKTALSTDFRQLCEENIDRAADAIEKALDLDYLFALLKISARLPA